MHALKEEILGEGDSFCHRERSRERNESKRFLFGIFFSAGFVLGNFPFDDGIEAQFVR